MAEFLTQLNYSPPRKAVNVLMGNVKAETNTLLQPLGKHWDDLDDHQQVKMSFLLLRNCQHLLLRSHPAVVKVGCDSEAGKGLVADIIEKALTENETYGKKLTAFVRKGGDRSKGESSPGSAHVRDHYEEFLRRFPQWRDHEKAPSIFNDPDDFRRVQPLLRFQETDSTLCYLVSVSNAIFYNMGLNTGTEHDVAVQICALNIGRFMRHEFSDEEVFEYIFAAMGGYPDDTFERLLQVHNPGMRRSDLIRTIPIDLSEGQSLKTMITKALGRFGALVIEKFKLFNAYQQSQNLIFKGDWNAVPKDPRDDVPHAVLVTGVNLTDDGEVEYEVQDSWEERPFFIVGHDFLLSMGVKQFLAVEEGLKFSSDSNNFPNSPHELRSGISSISESDTWDDRSLPLANTASEDSGRDGGEPGMMPSYWGIELEPNATYIWTGPGFPGDR
jgi:hypothetical protein